MNNTRKIETIHVTWNHFHTGLIFVTWRGMTRWRFTWELPHMRGGNEIYSFLEPWKLRFGTVHHRWSNSPFLSCTFLQQVFFRGHRTKFNGVPFSNNSLNVDLKILLIRSVQLLTPQYYRSFERSKIRDQISYVLDTNKMSLGKE